jgi:hypothetical protein
MYPLVIIFAILFLGIYIHRQNQNKLSKEPMTDFQVEPIRRRLQQRRQNPLHSFDETCDLYSPKLGSVQYPPALLDHEKGVWIDSKELDKKINAIQKSAIDKGVWQSKKMNTYLNSKVTPFDLSTLNYDNAQTLDETKEVVINPIVTSFNYNQFEPTNPSSYSTVNGPVEYTSFYTKAPKTKYVFSKKYGYRTYE